MSDGQVDRLYTCTYVNSSNLILTGTKYNTTLGIYNFIWNSKRRSIVVFLYIVYIVFIKIGVNYMICF